jgi:hypothetical protein
VITGSKSTVSPLDFTHLPGFHIDETAAPIPDFSLLTPYILRILKFDCSAALVLFFSALAYAIHHHELRIPLRPNVTPYCPALIHLRPFSLFTLSHGIIPLDPKIFSMSLSFDNQLSPTIALAVAQDQLGGFLAQLFALENGVELSAMC